MNDAIRSLLEKKNQWLTIVFVVYLFGILAFGCLYCLLYKQNRSNFAFNSDILRSQKDGVARSTREQLEQSSKDISLVREVRAVATDPAQIAMGLFAPGSAANLIATFECPAGKYVYTEATAVPGPLPTRPQLRVERRDGSTQEVRGGPIALTPRTTEDLGRVCAYWEDELRTRDEELRRILTSIEGDTPDVWTFPDFIYFSAITQCTVGYGDILPNSTPVRFLVTLQTIFSTGLVVVVINFTIQSRQPTGSGS